MNSLLAFLTIAAIGQTTALIIVIFHIRELRLTMAAILANLIRVRNKVAPMSREEEQLLAMEVYGES